MPHLGWGQQARWWGRHLQQAAVSGEGLLCFAPISTAYEPYDMAAQPLSSC